MEQYYTDYSLIKFIYSDLDLFEHLEVENAIKEDQVVQSKITAFRNALDELSDVSFVPSTLSLQKIKMYSSVKDIQLN